VCLVKSLHAVRCRGFIRRSTNFIGSPVWGILWSRWYEAPKDIGLHVQHVTIDPCHLRETWMMRGTSLLTRLPHVRKYTLIGLSWITIQSLEARWTARGLHCCFVFSYCVFYCYFQDLCFNLCFLFSPALALPFYWIKLCVSLCKMCVAISKRDPWLWKTAYCAEEQNQLICQQGRNSSLFFHSIIYRYTVCRWRSLMLCLEIVQWQSFT